MATLMEQFLESQGINVNVRDMLYKETGLEQEQETKPFVPDPTTPEGRVYDNIYNQILNGEAVKYPDGKRRKLNVPEEAEQTPEQLAEMATQEYLRQLKQDTGFGQTFTYYAVEPLLGLAEKLENIEGLGINLDEGKAQLFKDMAAVASEDNEALRTAATVGGALTSIGATGVTGAGRSVGTLVGQGFGLGRRAGNIASGATTGAIYGSTIPELEEGTDSATNKLLGTALGAAVPALPALARGGSLAVQQAMKPLQKLKKDKGAIEAPKPKPNTPIGRAMQATAEGLDYIGGTLSTRIGNISEPILNKMRKFEFDTKSLTSDLYKEVEPFVVGLSRLTGADKNLVAKGLYNGRFDTVEEVLKRNNPELIGEFNKVRGTLEKVRKDLVKAGYKELQTGLAEYFPRLVKDYKGLLNQLDATERTAVDRALREKASSMGVKVSELDPVARTEVINGVIRGFPKSVTMKTQRLKSKRKVDEVDDDLLPYYATPEESLEMYLRAAAHNIEKSKFFGLYGKAPGKRKAERLDESVGKYLEELERKGELTADQVSDLIPLIQSRFIQGEVSPSRLIKAIREFGYATTIANPLSALVQLGDLAVSGVINGLRATIASMFGKKMISIDDIGLRDTIVQELERSGRGLERLFRISGFKRIDRLGKETFVNAAWRKQSRQVRTEEGAEAFRAKYGKLYGNQTEEIIADMRAGNVTENVKFHLFNELSGIQPISLLEVPQAYLNSPNGRIFYMLKSFTIKQYDLLRKNIVQEAKKGNIGEATKFAARYAIMISLANGTIQTIRDVLTGRITSGEEAIEKFPDQLVWESLSVLGFNQYVSERYLQQGDIVGFGQSLLTPAAPMFEAAAKEIADLASESSEAELEPIARSAPLVGPAIPLLATWYNFMFGGLEDYVKEQDEKNE